jgi:glycosyltransferase involved in cell wall biosynthesis
MIIPEATPHIMIISAFFPPENHVAVRRIESWARYWPQMGAKVTVITRGCPEEPLPEDLRSQQLLNVLRLDDPSWCRRFRQRRLEGEENILDEKTAIGPRGINENSIPSLPRRLAGWLKSLSPHFIDTSLTWTRPAIRAARAAMLDKSPLELSRVVVVASFPPLAPLLVGARIAREFGVPLCIDYRDIWVESGIYKPVGLFKHINRFLRRRIEGVACKAVVVSNGQGVQCKAQSDLPVTVIQNGFDFARFPMDEPPLYVFSDAPIVIRYTGNIFPPSYSPELLFRALALLGPLKKRFRVEFYGTQPELVVPMIASFGVGDVCKGYQRVAHNEAICLQRQSGMLLLLDWTDPGIQGCLTGKVFEYIASGRPILLTGAWDGSELASLLRDADAGYVLGSAPEEIAAFLEKVARNPEAFLYPRPVSVAARQFDRITLAEKYLEMLKGLALECQP